MKLGQIIVVLLAMSCTLLGMDYVPNQLIFKTTSTKLVNNKTIGLESFDEFLNDKNVEKLKSILPKSDNKYFVATLQDDINWDEIKNYQFEGIEYIQPNYLNEFNLHPNDPGFPDQQLNYDNCNIPQSWDYTTGNEQILVAIVDSGLHFDHPDLQDNVFINENEIPDDGIDNDNNGYIDDTRGWDFVNAPELGSIALGDYLEQDNDPNDELNHGTHIAGIISATSNNSEGVCGISWNSKLLIVRSGFKTLDGGYLQDDDAASGIIYAADMGADVINLSWGDTNFSQIIADACYYAYNKGSIIVVAAGNEGATTSHQIVYPALFSTTLAVGAVDKYLNLASFSSYGHQLDVVAPGQLVYSTYDMTEEDLYKEQSGTSMAAPFVCAAIALLLSVEPGLDFAEVRGRLISSAHDLGEEGFDEVFGYGLLDVYSLLTDNNAPVIEIATPQDNTGLNSTFDIIGNVLCENLWRYSVKYTSEEIPISSDWIDVNPNISDYTEQVDNDVIAQFIVDNYVEDDTYKIKIEVVTTDQHHYAYLRTIYIDQTAPEFRAEPEYAAHMKRYAAEIPEYYIQALFDEYVDISLRQYPSTEFIPHFGETDSLQFIKINGLQQNVLIDIKGENLCGLETTIDNAYNFTTDLEPVDIHGFNQSIIGNELVSTQKVYDFDGNGINELFVLENIEDQQVLKIVELDGDELITKFEFFATLWPNDIGNTNASGMEVLGILYDRPVVMETTSGNYPDFGINVDENALGGNFADYDDDGVDEVILIKNEDIGGVSHRVITLNQRNGDVFEREGAIINPSQTSLKNSFSTKVACEKLDDDEYPDLITSDNDGDIMIFEYISGSVELAWSYRLPVGNAYNLCSGDFTGDGAIEFCVGGYNNDTDDASRSFSFYAFFENSGQNNYQPMGYLAFSEIDTKNSIASADFDGDGDEEIVIAVPPNIYIVDYVDGQFKPIWQGLSTKTSSNVIAFSGKTAMQDAYIITNIDNNGTKQSSLITETEEFTGPFYPQYFTASPLDLASVFLAWVHPDADYFKVYRKFDNNVILIADNVTENYYTDFNLTTGDTLYYQVTAVDDSYTPEESQPTLWEMAIPLDAPELLDIRMISQYELKLKFDLEVDNILSTLFSIEFGRGEIYPTSVNMIEQNTALILRFTDMLEDYEDYIISISGLTGKTGVPVDQGPYQFQYEDDTFPPEIINVTISNTNIVNIIFSEALEETLAEDIGNYTLLLPAIDRDNEIESLEYFEADSCFVVMRLNDELKYTNQPYFLKVDNLHDLAGNVISNNGNKCHFSLTSSLNTKNLKQMVVYPNPLDFSESLIDKMNFINLPTDVSGEIRIFNLDGELIFNSSVGPYAKNDLRSYFSWECENNSGNNVSSGIYFYHIKMGKDSRKGKIIVIN